MQTVIGLFETHQQTNQAIASLEQLGYSQDDMSVLGQKEVLPQTQDEHSETAEDAGKGAGWGGLVGLIAGATTLAIPGIGPVIGTGTILGSTFSGAGIGAAVGGLVGLFRNWLGHESDAQHYENAIKQGHIMLAVTSSEGGAEEVKDTLEHHGAYQVKHYQTEPSRTRA